MIRRPGLLRWLIPVLAVVLLFMGAFFALTVVGVSFLTQTGD